MRGSNWVVGLLCSAFIAMSVAVNHASARLIPQPIGDEYKITRSVTRRELGIKLFNVPYGLDLLHIDGQKVMFVTDATWQRVVYSDLNNLVDPNADTVWIRAFGEYGTGDGQFRRPQGMSAASNGDVYVADMVNNRIVKLHYSSSNETLGFLDDFGSSYLLHPRDVAFYGDKAYVVDTEHDRIVRFSSSGAFETAYGSSGSGPGQFNQPRAIDKYNEFVYVVDRRNRRIVVLLEDATGEFSFYGARYITDMEPNLVELSVDTYGNVFVVDKKNCRILKHTPRMEELLWSFGSEGYGRGQFMLPKSLTTPCGYSDVGVVEEWGDQAGIQSYYSHIWVQEASASPNSFDASEEETQIRFKMDDAADVWVGVYDSTNTCVRHLVDSLTLPAGTHEEGFLIWEGKDDSSWLVLPGTYTVKITARDGYGNTDGKSVPVTVEGTVVAEGNTSGIWTTEGEPYVVCGDVWVPEDNDLIIHPRVKVMFWPDPALRRDLSINGTLKAIGDATDSILFTSYKKYEERTPGDWGALSFQSHSNACTLKNCRVEFGGDYYVDSTTIYIAWHDSTRIINCTISSGLGYGLYPCDGRARPVLTGNTFEKLGSYPVRIIANDVGLVSTTNTFIENAEQAIEVIGGDVTTSATWARCDVGWRYDMLGGVYVGSDSSPVLTIEPGVTLRFPKSHCMTVGSNPGGLYAVGKPDSFITFTSIYPDPPPDSMWGGINFEDNTIDSVSVLDYCLIEHAWAGAPTAMISISNSSPTLRRLIITGGAASGIKVMGPYASPTITGCTISDNTENGIYCVGEALGTFEKNEITGNSCGVKCESWADPIIHTNNICGNATYGVCNGVTSDTADARFNWWGHGTGPYDPSPGPPDHNPEGQGDAVTDYVAYRPWLYAPLLFSNDPEATAWNNSDKIACHGSDIHLVYQSGGEIHYRHSPDKGLSWDDYCLLGEGETPAIAIDPSRGNPGVAWIGPEEVPEGRWLYYAGYEPELNPPWRVYPLILIGGLVRPYLPSLAIDSFGYGHIVWEEESVLGPQSGRICWWLKYGYFDAHNPPGEPMVPETVDHSNEQGWRGSPSLASDESGNPHIVWRKGTIGEICHGTKVGEVWTLEPISREGAHSVWPSVDFYGGTLSAIWQEQVSTAFEIRNRRKMIGGEWQEIEEVTNTGVDSYHPVVLRGKAAIWAETVDGGTDIFFSLYRGGELWEPPERVKATDEASMYPHMAPSGGSDEVWLCWTEGDEDPYIVQLEVAPFAVREKAGANSGHVTKDMTWKTDVHITGDVWVDPGVTLTIEPGVKVRFAAGSDDQQSGLDPARCELIVDGGLNALGDSGNPITFTSDARRPSPGDWYGIRFVEASPEARTAKTAKSLAGTQRMSDLAEVPDKHEVSKATPQVQRLTETNSLDNPFSEALREMASRSHTVSPKKQRDTGGGCELGQLRGCWIGYAVRGVSVSGDRPLALRRNVLTKNMAGVYCSGSSLPILIENSIFENRTFGVYVTESANPNLGGKENEGRNLIYSNRCNLHNNTPNPIAAELNYWGTQNSEEISANIWDGEDDPSLGLVDFEPLWSPQEVSAGGVQSAADDSGIPKVFSLSQNCPNPCGQLTIINYQLPTPSHAILEVYDLSGRLVRTLVDERQDPGHYSISWDSRDLSGRKAASGIYFYRLTGGNLSVTKRLVVLR